MNPILSWALLAVIAVAVYKGARYATLHAYPPTGTRTVPREPAELHYLHAVWMQTCDDLIRKGDNDARYRAEDAAYRALVEAVDMLGFAGSKFDPR